MLAFVCVCLSLISQAILLKSWCLCVCLCVCVCAYMCVHRPILHFVNCGSIVVKKYSGNRSKYMTYFLRIFDVMVILFIS